MNKQKGFTMIELVVVIAILGILAAVALPRFMDASEDAHRAAVAGTAGALGAGVALVRAQWEINGSKGAVTSPVAGFGKGNVSTNNKGWPTGINGTPSCIAVWENVLQGSAPTVAQSGTGFDYYATAAGTICTYTYQRHDSNATITYDSDVGEVKYTFN
ncbi:MAG TPA: pilin [Pseudomonas sp.]|nr:pilin [Pseudomonas sp.]